ncbi:MAG TPA: DnaB-like helicase C-terminal domain-containing protein, partial [Tissierellaceae bacterium]|nr:DnaB-like helicase C-terminal domain-containing protein [Tissierellaceae bacterium]
SIDVRMLSKDGEFYYSLLTHLYGLGYQKFEEVSVFAFLQKNEELLEQYNAKGGYNTLRDLSVVVNVDNIDGYIDAFNKYCLLIQLNEKGFNVEKEFDKFEKMTSTQVFDYFEFQLNSITVDVASDVEFESFEVTEQDIIDLESGENIGIQYNKHSPLMNYLTLGIPKGNFTIIGSYINQGKSSMVSNMAYSIAKEGTKVGIIANEMAIKDYKILLLVYVLVNDLNYYSLTRKKLKMGQFSAGDKEMIKRAMDIIKNCYVPNLHFAKTFDYDMAKTRRIIKRWSKLGVELMYYDTLKADTTDESTWKDLIKSSRELYQLASKENIAIVGVMQLALHTNQRRVLDLDVLANGKQASEPASECIFFRTIHPNEKTGEKFEAKCYRFVKDPTGKYTNVKEMIELDPNKTYRVFFIAKTRNDKVGTAIIYEFKGHLNIWKELGFADIRPDMF